MRAGSASDWVKINVLPHLSDMPTVETDLELREEFFKFYMTHRENCDIWSDVNFPIETNFLSAVVLDDLEKRQFIMPYPLYDLSTIIPAELDRVKNCQIEGLKAHNPLDDSIASASFLFIGSNKRYKQNN